MSHSSKIIRNSVFSILNKVVTILLAFVSRKLFIMFLTEELLGLNSLFADLLGLPVIDNNDGKVYGKIKDVINRGASDIYVISTPAGERMMPVVDEFVKKVDTESGVYVEVIPGLLTDD